MHPNFEKAFEATKKGEYIQARKYYKDLLLDISTYSDYFLLKEILFLLDLKLIDPASYHYDLLEEIHSMNYSLIEDQTQIQKLKSKNDSLDIDQLILIQKGFFKTSYIGLDHHNSKCSIYFFIGREKYIIPVIDMNYLYLVEYQNSIYGYASGGELVLLNEHNVNSEFKQIIQFINAMLFDYHHSLEHPLVNVSLIHNWFNQIDEKMNVDVSRLELTDLSEFHFDENVIHEIRKQFSMMAPIMWLSDNDDLKVPVQDMQYDLLGNKWGNHRSFLEWLTILKVMPFIQFGKSVFIHKESYYLPYENSYYIIRSITRLENDLKIDEK